MAEFLKEWIVSIAVMSLAGGFILIICPDGGVKKNLKLSVSLLMLTVIISPFFSGGLRVSERDILKELKGLDKKTDNGKKVLEGSEAAAKTVLENEIRSRFTKEKLFYSYVKADIFTDSEKESFVIKAITLYTKPEEREKAEDILKNQLKADENCIIVRELE